ncbi:MAG: hypothetical protein V7752_08385 [Halopseudomonas sp.]
MANALIILLGYSIYLIVVAAIVVLSWYSEKLDPSNELPDSIWDEIFPDQKYSKRRPVSRKQGQSYRLPLIPLNSK